jgi:hypothetical protein
MGGAKGLEIESVVARSDSAVFSTAFQPGGGTTCTMLPHFAQARIWPIAAGSRTLSRAWQVVHVMVKSVGFTARGIRVEESHSAALAESTPLPEC